MYSNYDLFREHENLVDQAIDFFTAEATNPEKFQQICNICVECNKKYNQGKAESLIYFGYLSVGDFFWYMNETKQIGKGLKLNVVDILVKLLEENFILMKLDSFVNKGNSQSYKCNGEFAKWLYERSLIKNLIFGLNYIIEKYSDSVFKIVVKLKSKYDDLSIGTGFLFRIRKVDGTTISTVITNKHVIEEASSFSILTKNDTLLPHSKFYIDNERDIALIELEKDIDVYSFHIYPQVKELSDIITIGYPSIPMTKEAYQICHKGEINSHIEDYRGNKFFLFSAKTSSGNSGSPVIDKFGLVAGMVTEELFEEEQFQRKGKLPYYAAIPGIEIIDFINNNYLAEQKIHV